MIVGLLWFVGGFNYLTRLMLTTMHGSIVHAIPMTESQFGSLTSVFLVVYGCLSPVAGFMADRFSRSRVIIISMIAWSAITWLTGYARTFEQLLIMRAIMGVSEACYLPAALALITDYHRGSTRSFAIGVHMTGISLGSALGGLGGWLADHKSWSFAFNAVGLVGIGYGLVLVLFLRDAPREQGAFPLTVAESPTRFWAGIVSLFSRGAFILTLLFWGLMGFVGWVVSGWMPTYFHEHFHLSQGAAGFQSTGYAQFAGLFGMLFGGWWADRWSRTQPRARIFVPAIGLCIAAPAIVLTAHSDLLTLAIVGMTAHAFFRNFTDSNMMPILCMVSDPRYRATGYGVMNCFSCLVGGVAVFAGGYLRDAHVDLSHIFMFAAGSMLVCVALVLMVKPIPEADVLPAEELGVPVQ